MKYRKKPVVIEAEQFHLGQPHPRGVCLCQEQPGPHLHTIHAGQSVLLMPGDWVIPEADGEHFYPCKPDVFAATYDEVGAPPDPRDGKPFNCYRLDNDYRSLKIFWFDEGLRRVDMVTEHKPNKGLGRRERYDVIAKDLAKAGFKVPDFTGV